MAKKKPTYRIIFHNQGKVYELYSHTVRQGELFGFIEIGDIIFGERSAVLIDPSEERLKTEFGGREPNQRSHARGDPDRSGRQAGA